MAARVEVKGQLRFVLPPHGQLVKVEIAAAAELAEVAP
jgi:hypothetical protein